MYDTSARLHSFLFFVIHMYQKEIKIRKRSEHFSFNEAVSLETQQYIISFLRCPRIISLIIFQIFFFICGES